MVIQFHYQTIIKIVLLPYLVQGLKISDSGIENQNLAAADEKFSFSFKKAEAFGVF